MLRPNRSTKPSNNNNNYGMDVGYGGGYSNNNGGSAATESLYGGGGSSSSYTTSSHGHGQRFQSDVFKDKPQTKVPSFLQKPVLWLGIVCFIMVALVYSYKSQQGWLLQQTGTKSLQEVALEYHANQMAKEELNRQVKTLQASDKQTKAKVSLMERRQKELEAEVDKFRKGSEQSSVKEQALRKMLYQIQNATQRESKRVVIEKFGEGPHRVRLTAVLPSDGSKVSFVLETAPLDLMPHSVHLFLEQVVHGLWDNGWFYVNGVHVAQIGPQAEEEEMVEGLDERSVALRPFERKNLASLAYPEYSHQFPHEQWTVGFTGRPGGPDWYINKRDNVLSHGPGGQQNQHDLGEYGDPCFAKVVDGFDSLNRIFAESTLKEGEYRFFFEYPVHVTQAELLTGKKTETTETKLLESTPGVNTVEITTEVKRSDGNATSDSPAAAGDVPQSNELPNESVPEKKEQEVGNEKANRERKHEERSNKKPLRMAARFEHQVEP